MTGFEKFLTMILTKQGLFFGLLVGVMKVLKNVRDGELHLVTAITDLFAASIVGYIAYEVVSLTDISEPLKILWTIFLASNAFFVIATLSDKEMLMRFVRKYLKK